MAFEAHTANAVTTTAAHPQAGGSMLTMLMIFFIISYFLIWRPQSKRAAAHRALLDKLSVGNEVLVNGSFVGKVEALKDTYVTVRVSETATMTVTKAAITQILPEGTL